MSRLPGETGAPLDALMELVREAAGGRITQRVVGALARETRAMVTASFASEQSPEGNAWKPLRRPRPGRILDRTGRLRKAATRVLIAGQRIVIDAPVYGPFHQDGTRRMPARPFLPDPNDPRTRERYQRAIEEVLQEAARGAR